ncbi:hypothetical protein ACQKGO_07985 [Corallococcus interemptor]|uniref:hypothetical protein n=1 Tax=Corallococcus interemptor TaxID=2316720 RepID=UPI003D015A17
MRRSLMLGLAVVGLQLGCGMDEAEQRAATGQERGVSAHYICRTDSLTIYYSDATYTTEVGSDRCFCGSTPLRTGRMTPYAQTGFSEECPGQLAPAAR